MAAGVTAMQRTDFYGSEMRGGLESWVQDLHPKRFSRNKVQGNVLWESTKISQNI